MTTIIDDQSPYYTRFTWPHMTTVLSWLQAHSNDPKYCQPHPFPDGQIRPHTRDKILVHEIHHLLPGHGQIPWSDEMSIFISKPGDHSTLHKDMNPRGPDYHDRVGLNFPIEIHDNCCETLWVDDAVLKAHPDVEYTNSYNVQMLYYQSIGRHTIPKTRSISLQHNEVMLVNTIQWHAWQNESPHTRRVASLRLVADQKKHFDFQKIHSLLFV
jgi:hypothetical protein